MPTDQIITWLRIHAKGADYTWRRVMLEAAERLEQLADMVDRFTCENRGTWITKNGVTFCSECLTSGSKRWKCCPVCEAKMGLPEEVEK